MSTYTKYFAFRGEPFAETATLPPFYTNAMYQRAQGTLLSGIQEHKGFLLLTGESGTGKTALTRRLMKDVEPVGQSVFFDSTHLACATIDDVLSFICVELGLHASNDDRVEKLRLFSTHLSTLMHNGGTGVLFVDEAHHLNDEVLGGLRMLAPLDKKGERLLLQIVLIGQPVLEQRLAEPNLRPILQRIALRSRLTRLEDDEVATYILHRLRTVGYERSSLFGTEAVQHVARASRGIPRVINLICDHALLLAYRARRKTVSAQLVAEAVTHLRIGEPAVVPSASVEETPALKSDEISVTVQTPTAPAALLSSLPGGGVVTAIASRKWRYLAVGLLLALGVTLVAQRQPWPLFSTSAPPMLESPQVSPAEDTQPLTLPVNRPPQIVNVSPQASSVHLTAGTTQQFTVALTDPDTGQPVEALWSLDGKSIAQGPEWTFAPSLAAPAGEHSLTMTATDAEGATVEKRWVVTVTPSIPVSPRIVRVEPPPPIVKVAEGQAVSFAVDVANPHPDLRYTWLLDGKERASGPRWTYRPQFTDGGQTKMIVVQVQHPQTLSAEQQWTVDIQHVNRPPVIKTVEPRTQKVTIEKGTTQRFAIAMTDPDRGDQLTAVWTLDGNEVAQGPTWMFTSALDHLSSQHVVQVAVVDQNGLKVEKRWRVAMTDPALPLLPPAAAQPVAQELAVTTSPPLTDDPPAMRLQEDEVRAWVEAHRRALEERQVDTLIELGALSSQQRERVQERLSQYKNFRVTFRDIAIHVEGRRAEVSFLRIDLIEEAEVAHPERQRFILYKGDDGRMSAQPQ